ncbi:class I adenylate-forming enzyme family protein [Nocardioides humi]|uniref:Long-chain-fatty-acid--CoA ligase n=1 Tax=Nocardioides humi TaxID=449461 RepID=A0ABN1ZT91_9ACTN|nr:class I adenylate-forming enzyme family protein [Nocardioides humi]
MIGLLERAAADRPEQVAVVTPETTLTYAELYDGARRVAAGLRARGIDRFAVLEPDAAWILRLLGGAAAAGSEPCQYQPDLDPAQFAEQAAALGHDTVVTRRTDLPPALTVVRPDELDGDPAEHASYDGPQPLMIRTTGTTGLPKAARHDWAVLTRRGAATAPRPEQRWLLAYGPQQFAGIQVLLHVLAAQATLVAPFPRQPRDGLAALLRDELTCVSATPTYWRFLLAEARSSRAELPPLAQVTLGGEASSPDLLEELREAFPTARISQVYASTEFGSIASVRDGRPGLSADSLWSPANPDAVLRVRDGELQVRAGTGMLGYAGDTTDAPEEVDGWVSTGDLVEVVDDRVLFRGRSSEVINVGGVKVHPLPIEERVGAVPGVRLARVHGRSNPMVGAVVAVEVVLAGDADERAVKDGIRTACADLPRAWQPRSIRVVDEVDLAAATRGGKMVRG